MYHESQCSSLCSLTSAWRNFEPPQKYFATSVAKGFGDWLIFDASVVRGCASEWKNCCLDLGEMDWYIHPSMNGWYHRPMDPMGINRMGFQIFSCFNLGKMIQFDEDFQSWSYQVGMYFSRKLVDLTSLSDRWEFESLGSENFAVISRKSRRNIIIWLYRLWYQ